MAHAQKPDFVFRRNGRILLNRQGSQSSRLLAAEVCASAVVMLDAQSSEVVWRVLAPFASFPFTSPPVCHRVPSRFNWISSTSNSRFSLLCVLKFIMPVTVHTGVRSLYTVPWYFSNWKSGGNYTYVYHPLHHYGTLHFVTSQVFISYNSQN